MSRSRVSSVIPKMATAAPTIPEQLQIQANDRLAKQMAAREQQELEKANQIPTGPPPPQEKNNAWGNYTFYNAIRGGKGRKSRKLGNKFNRCVKSVRSTVRARKGSNKESAAIAICVKSVLHTRGKTMKRYRKGRLITQKKFRGGCWTGGNTCA